MRLFTAALAAALAAAAAAQAQTPTPTPAKPAAPAPHADANGDGKLTLAELEAAEHRGALSRLDINRDGVITRPEFKNLVDFASQRGGEAAGKQAAAMFLLLDADKNGSISLAERDAATKRRFQMVDTNHDGWLSQAEVAASGPKRPRAQP